MKENKLSNFYLILFGILALFTFVSAFPAVGQQLLEVRDGAFMMGSNYGESDERPPRKIEMDTYYIFRDEVTNAQYAACVAAGVCNAPAYTDSAVQPSYYGNHAFDTYPMINVDWNMADTYCRWIGGSLPTEAQWEKAARGRNGIPYPWGDYQPEGKANYDGTDPKTVGSYTEWSSPYDAQDMAGNVAEWVNDWYAASAYQTNASVNPKGPDTGVAKVVRGGSYLTEDKKDIRASARDSADPSLVYLYIGFRCVSNNSFLSGSSLLSTSPVVSNDSPENGTPNSLAAGRSGGNSIPAMNPESMNDLDWSDGDLVWSVEDEAALNAQMSAEEKASLPPVTECNVGQSKVSGVYSCQNAGGETDFSLRIVWRPRFSKWVNRLKANGAFTIVRLQLTNETFHDWEGLKPESFTLVERYKNGETAQFLADANASTEFNNSYSLSTFSEKLLTGFSGDMFVVFNASDQECTQILLFQPMDYAGRVSDTRLILTLPVGMNLEAY